MSTPVTNNVETNQYLQWLEASIAWWQIRPSNYISPNGKLNDRHIKHDIMHLLVIPEIRRPIVMRFEDEYTNGIIQAVLEGRASLCYRPHATTCGRDEPGHEVITEDRIRKTTLPELVEFIKHALTASNMRHPKNFRENLSSEFINQYIQIGKNFRRGFREKYGKEYVGMNIDEFMRIPFSELKTLFGIAKQQAQLDMSISSRAP